MSKFKKIQENSRKFKMEVKIVKSYFSKDILDYDGSQLSSLFAYRTFGIQGDSIVAFIGGAKVDLEHMVDLADVRDQAFIYSEEMLHFIVENFALDLEKAVFQQRMLVTLAKEIMEKQGIKQIIRSGDDLYLEDKKMSVSIATLSPVSSMIHFAINISSQGTPVPTIGLADMGIEPVGFASELMTAYRVELESIYMARCKVRSVD